MKSFIISLLIFASIYLISVDALSCGRVFEGPHAGHDRKYQHSGDTVLANWDGFDSGSNSHVTYSYALISENITTKAILESGWDAPDSTRCRSTSGLTREADLVDFRFGNVGHNTSAVITNQRLFRGVTYYVIIKATEGGHTIYSNSNGIEVIKDDDDDLHPYQQGLIAMGCAIFCLLCLCLLLLLLLLLAKGRSEDKYTTTVHRNENVEKV